MQGNMRLCISSSLLCWVGGAIRSKLLSGLTLCSEGVQGLKASKPPSSVARYSYPRCSYPRCADSVERGGDVPSNLTCT